MGLFTKKKVMHEAVAYYSINGVIYQFAMRKLVSRDEAKYTRNLFFNKYGVCVRKYDIEYNEFAEWDSIYYKTLDEIDMTNAHEVRERDLDKAIEDMKAEFKKKFDDFDLNETLYTYNEKYYDNAFPTVVKVRKKLINNRADNITRQLLLEVEMLDGKMGSTKREFITFHDFLTDYDEGCPVKVLDSNGDYENSIDDYFW